MHSIFHFLLYFPGLGEEPRCDGKHGRLQDHLNSKVQNKQRREQLHSKLPTTCLTYCVLRIKKFSLNDAGPYQCVSTNSLGRADHVIRIYGGHAPYQFSVVLVLILVLVRLEICQKIYTTGFSRQKFYTLKVRKLRLFLQQKKPCKGIDFS